MGDEKDFGPTEKDSGWSRPSATQEGALPGPDARIAGMPSASSPLDPSPLDNPLDNAVWHALTTAHREFAELAGRAGRYDPEVSVFAAADELDDGSWRDLATVVGPGGTAILFRDTVPEPPSDWTRIGRGVGHQMVLRELAPVSIPAARPLGPDDVGEMLALVELTQPGPFRVRTVELGAYFGVFDGPDLVAMAGERLRFPGFCEVSAVCTHPDWRGRGLAAGLTALVAQGIGARGEQAFLHHASDNDPARRVYEALGFELRREVSVAVLGAP
jgi:ribosomal protein S18 acetylase RimI-like enzyme